MNSAPRKALGRSERNGGRQGKSGEREIQGGKEREGRERKKRKRGRGRERMIITRGKEGTP